MLRALILTERTQDYMLAARAVGVNFTADALTEAWNPRLASEDV